MKDITERLGCQTAKKERSGEGISSLGVCGRHLRRETLRMDASESLPDETNSCPTERVSNRSVRQSRFRACLN